MGLGPQVCEHCQVMYDLSPPPNRIWYCPVCGRTDSKEHTGFDPERWEQLEANQKFYDFVLNNTRHGRNTAL